MTAFEVEGRGAFVGFDQYEELLCRECHSAFGENRHLKLCHITSEFNGYWALEPWASGFGNYVWKRLLIVSAEDCWCLITAEVKALHDSYLIINDNVPARKAKGRIFISKAVIILCAAKKSRDRDHLQNLVDDELKGVDADSLADDLRNAPEYVPIPDHAFDCQISKF